MVQADALAWLPSQPEAAFDLAFVDPPFSAGLWEKVLPPGGGPPEAGRLAVRRGAAGRGDRATAAMASAPRRPHPPGALRACTAGRCNRRPPRRRHGPPLLHCAASGAGGPDSGASALSRMTVARNRIAVYPGTFDPITNGHIDLVDRAAPLFERLIIGVAESAAKGPALPLRRCALTWRARRWPTMRTWRSAASTPCWRTSSTKSAVASCCAACARCRTSNTNSSWPA